MSWRDSLHDCGQWPKYLLSSLIEKGGNKNVWVTHDNTYECGKMEVFLSLFFNLLVSTRKHSLMKREVATKKTSRPTDASQPLVLACYLAWWAHRCKSSCGNDRNWSSYCSVQDFPIIEGSIFTPWSTIALKRKLAIYR